jgi:hypothetical protein
MDTESKLIGKAHQFNEKIDTIKEQFFSALDDFKKYYVYFNKNPEVNEFQNYYATSKGQLQSMSNNLISTTNNIYKNIELLNDKMMEISKQLENEKLINDKLTKQQNALQNTENGSEILIDDAKTEYNIQYYRNWEIFIGIYVVMGAFIVMFEKQRI